MKTRRGFTLIDLIIAIVVLGIIMTGILYALMTPVINSVVENKMNIALFLAQERMEQIFSAKANSSFGYTYITTGNYPAENPVSGFTGYNRSVAITEVAGSNLTTTQAGSGFKKVVVTVSWDNGNASLSLTDLLGNY